MLGEKKDELLIYCPKCGTERELFYYNHIVCKNRRFVAHIGAIYVVINWMCPIGKNILEMTNVNCMFRCFSLY